MAGMVSHTHRYERECAGVAVQGIDVFVTTTPPMSANTAQGAPERRKDTKEAERPNRSFSSSLFVPSRLCTFALHIPRVYFGCTKAKVVSTTDPCVSSRSKLSGWATKSSVTTVFPP